MDKIREMTDEERQRATERYKANHGSSCESLFKPGAKVTTIDPNTEIVEVVNVPHDIDLREYNRLAKEFAKANPDLIKAAIRATDT